MGNAISFRLNPKCESDRKILAWLEEKSSQPGYMNQTELIKQALITAMVQEEKGVKEKEDTQWMDEAIHKAAEEFAKVVQETSQNVANNTFAGVMGAMMQQMNMGVMPMNLGQVQQVAAAGCANPSVISKEMAAPDTEQNLQENELVSGGYMNSTVIGMRVPVNGMSTNVPNMVSSTTETQVPDDELKTDDFNGMDNDTKSKLGNLFDMDDD